MRAAVLVFPGSNCDRDLAVAFRAMGMEVSMVWHKATSLPNGVDIVGVPGGFSFGDYLRSGAIAARSPITPALAEYANSGGYIIGICNGFQVLTETGLLPGALMRNAGLKFVCRRVALDVATSQSVFTQAFPQGARIELPVAHHDGNYSATPETVAQLEAEDRIALRYAEPVNGSVANIAGVLSENRRVLGLMPHPERAIEPAHGGQDGARVFQGLCDVLAAA
jgi:phosphoribosylformylglycinamidine synthase